MSPWNRLLKWHISIHVDFERESFEKWRNLIQESMCEMCNIYTCCLKSDVIGVMSKWNFKVSIPNMVQINCSQHQLLSTEQTAVTTGVILLFLEITFKLSSWFIYPADDYMFKVNNRNIRTRLLIMFKVNNKDTRTTPMATRGVFRTLSNIFESTLSKNIQWLLTVNCFRKKIPNAPSVTIFQSMKDIEESLNALFSRVCNTRLQTFY